MPVVPVKAEVRVNDPGPVMLAMVSPAGILRPLTTDPTTRLEVLATVTVVLEAVNPELMVGEGGISVSTSVPFLTSAILPWSVPL